MRIYAAAAALVLLPSLSFAFKCTVCHSKKPAMVAMHRALQAREEIGCFDCHRVGEKLMGKGKNPGGTNAMERRRTEKVCQQCHTK